MKPVTLSLNGFRSYPEPVTIDFTGKKLAAALGDTGAGKSSLLDAITFALFRKSAWDARDQRQLIADKAQEMRVELEFLHDGQRWRVHRSMHATNANAGRNHLTNLDTGEEIDGADRVGARIKTVLQMGYDTFLRVGLLPQGKFDQLLTAARKERTTRLRELFGTDSLAEVRQIAGDHHTRLTVLIERAETKRAAMHDNPAQVAEAAGSAAADAEAVAARLNSAIETITVLREQISSARSAADSATAAADRLAERTVQDATTTLDALEPVAARIAEQRESLDRRAATATLTENNLAARIEQIEAGGEGRDALAKAAAVLENLAPRAEEHRGERDRITERTAQLAADRENIAADDVELTRRAERVQPLVDAAHAADGVTADLRSRASIVRARVDTAISAARRLADTIRAHHTTLEKLTADRRIVEDLEGKTGSAAEDLVSAEARLDALKLLDQAAGIAAELSPGDDCPVCLRQLPTAFEPASGTTTTEVRDAKSALRQSKVVHDKVSAELAQARANIALAETTLTKQSETIRAAELESHEATDTAQREFAAFAAFATSAGGFFDVEFASATLDAAVTAAAARTDHHATELEQLTEPVLSALAACEQVAADHAGRLHTEARTCTSTIEADRRLLHGRESENRDREQAALDASQRLTAAVARTDAEVRALPSRIRTLLPDYVIDVSVDDVAAAAITVADRLSEVQGILDKQQATRAETTAILTAQRDLDQEAHTRLQTPLTQLRDALDGWADAAATAIAHLDAGDRHVGPERPAQSGITEIREFAAELAKTTSALDTELNDTRTGHRSRAEAAITGLSAAATALADIDGFDHLADLTAPNALHPLVEAKTKAGAEAERRRTDQRIARNQVKPAADLDFAITAGRARLEALNVLRVELVEARFLGHLTTRNTRALLGIASELLGQLTDNRFGFADDFEIVSIGSEVVHHANRLSGGEKFLASLALALALAELHSHSGPRLGSLFLDEGFAALDTAALQAALDVLRSKAGGDRLVMVISHLHAVAEAVDDVLWVKRERTGSTARWLTPAERDELVHADVASGLQGLA